MREQIFPSMMSKHCVPSVLVNHNKVFGRHKSNHDKGKYKHQHEDCVRYGTEGRGKITSNNDLEGGGDTTLGQLNCKMKHVTGQWQETETGNWKLSRDTVMIQYFFKTLERCFLFGNSQMTNVGEWADCCRPVCSYAKRGLVVDRTGRLT